MAKLPIIKIWALEERAKYPRNREEKMSDLITILLLGLFTGILVSLLPMDPDLAKHVRIVLFLGSASLILSMCVYLLCCLYKGRIRAWLKRRKRRKRRQMMNRLLRKLKFK